MAETKVVQFPSRHRSRNPKAGDDKLADDVHKAWRTLWRKIALARAGGLTVQMDFGPNDGPHITKEFR